MADKYAPNPMTSNHFEAHQRRRKGGQLAALADEGLGRRALRKQHVLPRRHMTPAMTASEEQDYKPIAGRQQKSLCHCLGADLPHRLVADEKSDPTPVPNPVMAVRAASNPFFRSGEAVRSRSNAFIKVADPVEKAEDTA